MIRFLQFAFHALYLQCILDFSNAAPQFGSFGAFGAPTSGSTGISSFSNPSAATSGMGSNSLSGSPTSFSSMFPSMGSMPSTVGSSSTGSFSMPSSFAMPTSQSMGSSNMQPLSGMTGSPVGMSSPFGLSNPTPTSIGSFPSPLIFTTTPSSTGMEDSNMVIPTSPGIPRMSSTPSTIAAIPRNPFAGSNTMFPTMPSMESFSSFGSNPTINGNTKSTTPSSIIMPTYLTSTPSPYSASLPFGNLLKQPAFTVTQPSQSPTTTETATTFKTFKIAAPTELSETETESTTTCEDKEYADEAVIPIYSNDRKSYNSPPEENRLVYVKNIPIYSYVDYEQQPAAQEPLYYDVAAVPQTQDMFYDYRAVPVLDQESANAPVDQEIYYEQVPYNERYYEEIPVSSDQYSEIQYVN